MHIQRSILALAYLQFRIIVNWIRRSLRSIVVWVLALGALVVFLSTQVFAGSSGGSNGPSGGGDISSIYFEAGAVLIFLGTLLFAVWKGTGPPPRITQAEVIMILGSPIRTRIQFGWLIFRDMAALLGFITAFTLFSLVSSLVQAMTAGDTSLEEVFSSPAVTIWLIILIGGVTRFAVWVATEQVVARDPEGGHQLRAGIRTGMITLALIIAAWLIVPVLRASESGFRERADMFVYRVLDLAAWSPLTLPANILNDDASTWLALGGLILLTIALSGFGIYHARDFVEPIAITAERATDARGQSIDAGKDLHWASMGQLGKAPRMAVAVPPFGIGPWALLWNSLQRWARYEVAVAGTSLVVLAAIGVAAALGVRFGFIDKIWIWGIALSMPFFGSYNMFLDELRKPFIFMMPGAAWKRLLAAGATSVLDGTVGAAILVVIALTLRVLSFVDAVLILVAATALGFLIQAGIGLVQVVLPTWINKKLRTSLTFGINTLAAMPALSATIAGAIAGGKYTAYSAGVGTALITGVVVLALAVRLFDRMEMPG